MVFPLGREGTEKGVRGVEVFKGLREEEVRRFGRCSGAQVRKRCSGLGGSSFRVFLPPIFCARKAFFEFILSGYT